MLIVDGVHRKWHPLCCELFVLCSFQGCEWEEFRYLAENAPTALCRIRSQLQIEVHLSVTLKLQDASLVPGLFEHIMLDHGFKLVRVAKNLGSSVDRRKLPRGLTRIAPGIDTSACCYVVHFLRTSIPKQCDSVPQAEISGRRLKASHPSLQRQPSVSTIEHPRHAESTHGVATFKQLTRPTFQQTVWSMNGMPYCERRNSDDEHTCWLLVTNVACFDREALTELDITARQLASATFHVLINVFDSKSASCLQMESKPYSKFTTVWHVPGFKPHFWKTLNSTFTSMFDYLLLTDADVGFEKELGFRRQDIEKWFERTGASIIQPTVIPWRSGLRGGTGVFMQPALRADCLAKGYGTVERVYVARQPAFELFREALSRMDERVLVQDTYLERFWCVLLKVKHNTSASPCVFVGHISVVHSDTHMIRRQGYDSLFLRPSFPYLPEIKRLWPDVARTMTASLPSHETSCWGLRSKENLGQLWWENRAFVKQKKGTEDALTHEGHMLNTMQNRRAKSTPHNKVSDANRAKG